MALRASAGRSIKEVSDVWRLRNGGWEPPLPAPEDAMTAALFVLCVFAYMVWLELDHITHELKRHNDREERRP